MNVPTSLKSLARFTLTVVTGALLVIHQASAGGTPDDVQSQARGLLSIPLPTHGPDASDAPARDGDARGDSDADAQRQARELLSGRAAATATSGMHLARTPLAGHAGPRGRGKSEHADAQEAARRMILGTTAVSFATRPGSASE